MSGARLRLLFLVLAASLFAAACREEGDIQITGLDFNGVKQVDKGALTNALQTKKGSWIPWGRKRFFDRRAFEADLKRIQAFYADRGFPDARVTSFDVMLNDAQNKVDIVVNISEGEPIRVAAIELRGFDVLPEKQRKALLDGLPLQPEQPLDRQAELASRERAVNTLRDNGYPYAQVELKDEEAAPRQRRIALEAMPGVLARFGPVEIAGQASVGEHVIRRQLTFAPGEVFTRRELRETQRKLYGLELFEFVNVESVEDRDLQPEEVPVRVTLAEGKHRRVNVGVGYGTEEQARVRLRWDHFNFLRRRAEPGRRNEVVVPRSRRPHELSRAVFLLAALVDELRGTGLASGRAGVLAEPAWRSRDAAAPGEPAELLDGVAGKRVPAEHDPG
jgi:outer membrane protein insertion porin family